MKLLRSLAVASTGAVLLVVKRSPRSRPSRMNPRR